jgi:hypothetical protein
MEEAHCWAIRRERSNLRWSNPREGICALEGPSICNCMYALGGVDFSLDFQEDDINVQLPHS